VVGMIEGYRSQYKSERDSSEVRGWGVGLTRPLASAHALRCPKGRDGDEKARGQRSEGRVNEIFELLELNFIRRFLYP
jgi:hypothetical protein